MQSRVTSQRAGATALSTALAAVLAMGSSAAMSAEPVKVGVLLGFTGPIESLTPPMAAAAELAFKEISSSGLLLEGQSVEVITGDSTCTDAGAATAAAERLATADQVVAVLGAACSGVTIAVTNNVAVPNGLPMISPSATSPALTTIDDQGLFFRLVPSDARQGEVLAQVVRDRGIDEVAITYTNNDYGKGLSDSFAEAFRAAGGSVAITAAHEDGKADYSAEVAALSASGASSLMVFGYVDQGGKGIVQAAIDTDAFDRYFGGDGMFGQSIIESLGDEVEGFVATVPGVESEGADRFAGVAEAGGIASEGPFIAESYDAAALIAFAIQKAGKADRAAVATSILEVANAPGEPILPGELAKGLQILADGGDIDYVGATNVELTDTGESEGAYKELEIQGGGFATVGFR